MSTRHYWTVSDLYRFERIAETGITLYLREIECRDCDAVTVDYVAVRDEDSVARYLEDVA